MARAKPRTAKAAERASVMLYVRGADSANKSVRAYVCMR